MAILLMLVILIPVLSTSRSLATSASRLSRSPPEPLLFLDGYRRKPSIRQTLLDSLNTYSPGNEEKMEILSPLDGNKHYKYLLNKSTDGKNLEMVIPDAQINNNTSLAQLSYQKNSKISEKASSTTGLASKNQRQQQRKEENTDEWQKIRERRLRFYKAFRNIQELHRKRKPQQNKFGSGADKVDRVAGNTTKTLVVSHRRKKNGESSTDPIDKTILKSKQAEILQLNVTYNDWETFITDYSKVMPQYNRRSTASSDYGVIDLSTQSQTENESNNKVNGPPGYLPPIRIAQSPGTPGGGVERNPFDHQQLLTSLNSIRETAVPVGSEASERLPPAPNPRSTEASVHTVQVYPPPQQQQQTSNAADYQSTGGAYPNNNVPSIGNYYRQYTGHPQAAGIEQPAQSPSRLMAKDYDGDMTFSSEADPGCIVDPCEAAAVTATDDTVSFSSALPDDERCNSPRLKQIILRNIVERDAEASKRVIYDVCEAEMGVACNVICGTGFYSYVARATQFCLAGSLDVSCYAFVPACDLVDDDTDNFAKKRSKRAKRRRRTGRKL